ncbi:IS21-like element ISEc57 family transposase [Salmonella enterica subsp. enterica serovar Infantis]|nr:IS21-like element ISEc57 family transposase [Salmonella enterica subsp. enterica serovar Infantis]
MLTLEQAVTIQILHQQGQSIKAISRELGISRNTVRKYLRSQVTPKYQRTQSKVSILEPYKPYLIKRVNAADPEWIPAAVLYQEILQKGYTGKIRTLQNYLNTLKPTKQPEPIKRFETQPGQQMQVDFTTIRRHHTTLKAFVATLGYSRATFVKFYDHERSDAWIDGLESAFQFFGCVPKDVLFDNAKAIIIERDAYQDGQHRWNAKLLDCAKKYNFRARVCKPYRAQTKGKVERFNSYLKSSFIVPLKASLKVVDLSLDVDMANAYIGRWLSETANQRIHATTKEKPSTRLLEEQQFFSSLPLFNDGSKKSVIDDVSPSSLIPHESVQHPLSIYDELLEVS